MCVLIRVNFQLDVCIIDVLRKSVKAMQEEIGEWKKRITKLKAEVETGKVLQEDDKRNGTCEPREDEEAEDLPKDLKEQMRAFIPVCDNMQIVCVEQFDCILS